MKAVILEDKEKLRFDEMEIPQPRKGEGLIKVGYTGICGSDVHIYQGHHPTATFPVVLGHEFVGNVVSFGPETESPVSPGSRVTVEPLLSCGVCDACKRGYYHVCEKLQLIGIHRNGAFAEYVTVPAEKLVEVPQSLSDKLAALTEPFAVGFHVTERGELKGGEKVLIIGGGPIGLIIGMVALQKGAVSVEIAEINEERQNLIREFGFTLTDGKSAESRADYDLVFEVSGSKPGILLATRACRIRGSVVNVGFFGEPPQYDAMKVIFRELSIIGSRVYSYDHFKATLPLLDELAKSGRFPLEKLIGGTIGLEGTEEAIQTMLRGENLGKIIIDMNK